MDISMDTAHLNESSEDANEFYKAHVETENIR